jgi:hypothetical protein
MLNLIDLIPSAAAGFLFDRPTFIAHVAQPETKDKELLCPACMDTQCAIFRRLQQNSNPILDD